MKRSLLMAVIILMTGFAARAQNYAVVNTETIFKSIASYTDAVNSIDKMASDYQKRIDDMFADLEKSYNEYQSQKQYLNQSQRTQREEAIINREKEINTYQQQLFGQEGELAKRTEETLKPIRDRVYQTIAKYAEQNKYELILDISSNPMVIYYAPSADKTQDIIKLL